MIEKILAATLLAAPASAAERVLALPAFACVDLAPARVVLPPAAPALAAALSMPAPAPSLALPAPAAAAAPAEPRPSEAAARRAETPAEVSARMRADAERLGREFKRLEWRDDPDDAYGPRDDSSIYRASPGPGGRALLSRPGATRVLAEGRRALYVLTADGEFDVGLPKGRGRRENGVKHLQIADGREIAFAGEIRRRRGRLAIDLDSGNFSDAGRDARWRYTPENVALLEDYASALLGEPVTVALPRRRVK